VPKYTKGITKVIPGPLFLFDSERLKLCEAQKIDETSFFPVSDAVCPALLGARVAVKRIEADAKRVANLAKQRQRRVEVNAQRAAKPWVVLADGSAVPFGADPVQPTPEPGEFFTSLPAPAPVAVSKSKVRWLQAELAEAFPEPKKPTKRAKKGSESADELNVHTIDVTPPPFQPFQRLEKLRQQCREVGKLLISRDNIQNTLFKAGSKILNCSLWGLFQSVNRDVNYRVGTALCKCRLCPNCQRVLAARRKTAFLDWFELNRAQLRKYFFYHMVLTVRHKASTGEHMGLYTPDLLRYFAELRGTHSGLSGAEQRFRSKTWRHFVDGGSYSVEIAPGSDSTAHIHIHVLLLGNTKLFNRAEKSKFLLHIEPLWKEITANDDPKNSGVYIEPVYYTDPETKKPVYAFKGSEARVEDAVSECVKYTMKADAQALGKYSNDFLTHLLTMRNRYYSRFGCLHPKDKASAQFKKLEMLAQDYQDLEEVTREELARLFDPTTGELVDKEDTWMLATPLRNMEPQQSKPLPAPASEVLHAEPGPGRVPVLERRGSYVEDGDGLKYVANEEATLMGYADKVEVLGGTDYYTLKPLVPRHQQVWFPYLERQRAAIALSRSIGADYDAKLDFGPPAQSPVARPAGKSEKGANNFYTPPAVNAFRKKSKKVHK
jgi:hypothetical protein